MKRNRFGLYDGKACKCGGAALMEGVMMRGPKAVAMAVRCSDNSIAVIKKPSDQKGTREKISKIPFVRGVFAIFDSMVESVRYLMKSAEFVDLEGDDPNEKPSKFENFLSKLFGDKLLDVMLYISVVISLCFSIGLFMLLPKIVVELFGIDDSGTILKNLIEGVIRLLLFFGYIILASRMNEIKRVFSYHGAEHKTIHCYEHGEELTVENVRKYTTLHPRCGTAFMFLVLFISIFVYSLLDFFLNSIGWTGLGIKVFSRLLFMPLLAGISYEITRLASRSDNKFIKVLNAPGIAMQYITTFEPDDSLIEVGIASLNAVVDDSIPFTDKEEEERLIKQSQSVLKPEAEQESEDSENTEINEDNKEE